MTRVISRSITVALLSLAAAACGGGGDGSSGGGGDAIQVTCSPSRITSYFASWETGRRVGVRATLSPTPASAFPQLVDSGNVLVPGSVTVLQSNDGSFSVSLPLRDDLSTGQHTGTFTLRMCTDYACTATYPLTGNVIPYTITKTPPATTTATADLKVNGASSGTGGTVDGNGVKHYAVSVPSGATLQTVTTVNIVSWSFVSGAGHPTVQYTGVAPTQMSAVLTLSVPADTSETTTLRALAGDGQMFEVAVTVTQ
jgi:hypothetical protein